jgi:hypothetical protein
MHLCMHSQINGQDFHNDRRSLVDSQEDKWLVKLTDKVIHTRLETLTELLFDAVITRSQRWQQQPRIQERKQS